MTAIDDTELRLVVLEGAALVPKVEELVQRCTTDPDPGHDLARACGEVVSATRGADCRGRRLHDGRPEHYGGGQPAGDPRQAG